MNTVDKMLDLALSTFDELLDDFDDVRAEFEQVASQFPPDWKQLNAIGDRANDLGRAIHLRYSSARSSQTIAQRTSSLLQDFSHRVNLIVEHPGEVAEDDPDVERVKHYGSTMSMRAERVAQMEADRTLLNKRIEEMMEGVDFDKIWDDAMKDVFGDDARQSNE